MIRARYVCKLSTSDSVCIPPQFVDFSNLKKIKIKLFLDILLCLLSQIAGLCTAL